MKKKNKHLLIKILIGLVLVAALCVGGYFVVFHNADILQIQEAHIPDAQPTWLIGEKDGQYYHLADVAAPEGFSPASGAPLHDPLTTAFTFEGTYAGTPLQFTIAAAPADDAQQALFTLPSPVEGLAIAATASAQVEDASALQALLESSITLSEDAEALKVKERQVVGAKKTWLITKDGENYVKLGEVGTPRSYSTVKDLADTDADALTTFFAFEPKNAEKNPAAYEIHPVPAGNVDIGACADEGWGKVTLGKNDVFVYPENMDAANATAVYCLMDSPYENIDIQVKVTLPAPDTLENWLPYCQNMTDNIDPIKQLSPIAADFKLNFLDDNRWEGLLSGLGVTMKITFFATLLGIVIGILVAVVRSTWDKAGENMRPGLGKTVLAFFNSFCKFYLTIIRGTPVVIQLMLMYYVILINTHDGVLVAILSFGINSGAYVAEIIRAGIQSVDNGQFEAGRSLGFNYVSTMWHIIVPQAFKNVLPSLANEFIVLLKETSVAGYVAVRDLTKEGDLIRGTTFSAFMPLIAVAVIYLIIVVFFTWLVGKLERRLRNSDH